MKKLITVINEIKATSDYGKDYKYKWKLTDEEKPKNLCYDCHLIYGIDFGDMYIHDAIWDLINPSFYEGGGILCPNCIINRLRYLKIWYLYQDVYISYIKNMKLK